MSEVKITYETLFDLLRREKSREELQKLDPTFYQDVNEYLSQKQRELQDTSTQAQLFASSEKEKIRVQFYNIKKILRELYERREKKILRLALAQSRTPSSLTDTSTLLPDEKRLYHELTGILQRAKEATLQPLLAFSLPETHAVLEEASTPRKPFEDPPLTCAPLEQNTPTQPNPAAPPLASPVSTQAKLSLRFKSAVPRFLGTELEIYGPYQPNDTAELPTEIAQVLIQKGRAEEIK